MEIFISCFDVVIRFMLSPVLDPTHSFPISISDLSSSQIHCII